MVKNYALRFVEQDIHLFDNLKKVAQNNRRSFNAEVMKAIDFYLKNAPEAQYEIKEVKKKPSPK